MFLLIRMDFMTFSRFQSNSDWGNCFRWSECARHDGVGCGLIGLLKWRFLK